MRKDGVQRWLLADHLGGTTGLLDATGNLVSGSTTTYWPYGATRTASVQGAARTDLLYTGQREEKDDAAGLGLYNYKARFYSTVLGRFVSVDPLVGSAGDPQSWNSYTYVRNNPLRLVDPSGTYFEEPGDSAPSVKTKGFCGAVCRALKTLASKKIYTVEAAHAADRAEADLRGALVYLAEIAKRPAAAAAEGGGCGWNPVCHGKNATREITHSGVDSFGFVSYAAYYSAYETIGAVNSMPGQSEIALKVTFLPQYTLLLEIEAAGLAGNVAADAAETYVLGVDEPLADEGFPKNTVPGILRPLFDLLRIPQPVIERSPGLRRDEQNNNLRVDFRR